MLRSAGLDSLKRRIDSGGSLLHKDTLTEIHSTANNLPR